MQYINGLLAVRIWMRAHLYVCLMLNIFTIKHNKTKANNKGIAIFEEMFGLSQTD